MNDSWRRLSQLTVADLQAVPVWEFDYRGVEPGSVDFDVILNRDKQQEWVRPRLVEGLLVDDGTTYITLTEFTLADGTRNLGYCSPCDPSGLDYIQPIIVTPQGQVRFWYDWQPDFEAMHRCMELLGKTKAEIFPVEYRSLVQCDGSFWHGTIEEADL